MYNFFIRTWLFRCRYARENKKLLADSMRLEQENDKLAQQLLTKQIGMRTDMDRWERKFEARP